MPCQFGFTDFVFQQLEKELSKKSKKFRQGLVMFDEMKVRQEISFDKFKQQFNGFLDLGGNQTSANQTADHALVFMYRSVYSNMVRNYHFPNCELKSQ